MDDAMYDNFGSASVAFLTAVRAGEDAEIRAILAACDPKTLHALTITTAAWAFAELEKAGVDVDVVLAETGARVAAKTDADGD